MKLGTKGVIAALALAGSLAVTMPVSSAAGEWLVDAKSGCRVWNGFPEPGETMTWDGACENGFATGKGTLDWFKDGKPNGNYVGERKDGKANGYGINSWLSGDRYEGNWKDDQPNGKGTYTWANGSGYQGDWVEGRKEGNAVYIWANGDRFEGTYKGDRPFAGIYIKADGSRHLAEISDNSIGPGKRIFSADELQAVRQVGTKVCRPGPPVFGFLDTTLVGFVETVANNRIQIRIASTGSMLPQKYQDVDLSQNTIIWDDADNWHVCAGGKSSTQP
ncbi:MAG: hypothetical protein GC168_18665 [Candidatus Hydrogenedens sp.]|nr:hypothetical protein [Candidatus Hydrogenedens sp.]